MGVAAKHAIKSDGFWKYRRRVPEEFAALDERPFVKISTKVRIADDPSCKVAGPIVERLNRETEAFWQGLAAGKQDAAKARYHSAVRLARSRGFDYVPAHALADPGETKLDALLTRIETIASIGERGKQVGTQAALVGLEEEPGVQLSKLVDWYEEDQATSLIGFADDQKRKWRNPLKRAVQNLTDVLDEDKPVFALNRSDALELRATWQDRILEHGYVPETANKDFGHLSKMFTALCRAKKRDLENPFREMRFAGGGESRRVAYDSDFVLSKILAPGALAELNPEARAVVYIVAECGARPSEVCNPVFVLDHDVPHLSIQPVGRKTKTRQSVREIPLVGIALQAAEAFPNGFPRYRHKSDHLSNLVNKFFLNNGMRPTRDHTFYSLRHTFEDRLTAVEPPDKVQAALMGHKYHRPRYGKGPSLEQKQSWLKRIAYPATAEL